MGGASASAIFLAATLAATPPPPPPTCPELHDVEHELDRLGAAPALALKGTPDVTVSEAGLRIVLRGRDGKVLGAREVAAPEACQERAVVAAVVIAAWLGEWPASEPRAAAPRPPAPPPTLTLAAPAPPAARPRRSRPLRLELALFGSAVHDGDAATWAAGGEVAYGLGDRFSVTAQGHRTGERTQALGPGLAAYQSVGFGAGVSWRRRFGRAVLDAGLGPEAQRTALQGEQLATPRRGSTWALAIDGRIRLGLALGPLIPFVYAGTTYGVSTARLTLDNRPDQVTLSRWNVAAGLGLLFSFSRPAG
jgi:hypothetical protein